MKFTARLIGSAILVACALSFAQQDPEILMQGYQLDDIGCFWEGKSPYTVTWEVQFYGLAAGAEIETKYDFGPTGTFERIVTATATGAETTSVSFDSTFVSETDLELNMDIELWVDGEQQFARRPIGSCTVKVEGAPISSSGSDDDSDDDSGCGTGSGLAFLIPVGIRLGTRRKKK
ncbi:MAG: hypothetical protein GF350_15265 [Chitinivibrionales bacterium]|nr:hypothetical protein [Chitinivibrionales bacterium]